MKKLSVSLLTIITCCMLWACGKTATFNESEEETTTHKKNKTEYSTTAEDITESSERQTYSDMKILVGNKTKTEEILGVERMIII